MVETFSYAPNYDANADRQPTIKEAAFGDGYEQRQADGINALKEVWNLEFTNRSLTEGNAIDDFLKARGGVEAFYWTPPDGTQGLYVCKQWNRSKRLGNVITISAQFKQVFEAV